MRFQTHSFNLDSTDTIMDCMAKGHETGLAADIPVRSVYLGYAERNRFMKELAQMGEEFKEGMMFYGMHVFSE